MDTDIPLNTSDDNQSYVIINKITAETKERIEQTDKVLQDSSQNTINAILDKFNSKSVQKNPKLVDEIEKYIAELVLENKMLKDMLQQNNASMKNQLLSFTNLYDDVRKTEMNQKSKICELKTSILKMKDNAHMNNVNKKDDTQPMQHYNNQMYVENQSCIAAKEKITADYEKLQNHYGSLKTKHAKLVEQYNIIASGEKSEKEKELLRVITELNKRLEDSEKLKKKLRLENDKYSAHEMKVQRMLAPGDSCNVFDICYWNAVFPTVSPTVTCEIQLSENLKRLNSLIFEKSPLFLSDNVITTLSNHSSWINVNSNLETHTETVLQSQLCKLKNEDLIKIISNQQYTIMEMKEFFQHVKVKFQDIFNQCVIILKEHDTKFKAHNIEETKLKVKLKEMDELQRELCQKENFITQLETDALNLERQLNKKLNELDKKSESLEMIKQQVRNMEIKYNEEKSSRTQFQKINEQLKEKLSQDARLNDDRLNFVIEGNYNEVDEIMQGEFNCFNEGCEASFSSADELQTHVYSCLNLQD